MYTIPIFCIVSWNCSCSCVFSYGEIVDSMNCIDKTHSNAMRMHFMR